MRVDSLEVCALNFSNTMPCTGALPLVLISVEIPVIIALGSLLGIRLFTLSRGVALTLGLDHDSAGLVHDDLFHRQNEVRCIAGDSLLDHREPVPPDHELSDRHERAVSAPKLLLQIHVGRDGTEHS